MEPDRAIELYAEFRRHYGIQPVTPVASFPTLSDERTIPAMPMIIFLESTSDTLRELCNSTNDLRRWINTLSAWKPVYDSCDLLEKYTLLLEHIAPYATLVLGAPQALRGRMIFAAATACAHANYHLFPGNPDLQWNGEGHLTMAVPSRIGQPWEMWPPLAAYLRELGRGSISDGTSDYRNQREHGHPRNIGLGLISVVSVMDDGDQRSWGFGSKPAIELETVIELAVAQHVIAVKAHDALTNLAKEQFEALMDSAGAGATT